ncbi:MAG: DNRLRE domain-containing protein [Coriobacteriia bacterium]
MSDIRGETHALLRSWSETGATWNTPGDSSTTWGASGAQLGGSDYSTYASDSLLIEAGDRWYDFDVTALVRSWVRNPAENDGLIILASAGISNSNVEAQFASGEYGETALRPQLTVSYWVEQKAVD